MKFLHIHQSNLTDEAAIADYWLEQNLLERYRI